MFRSNQDMSRSSKRKNAEEEELQQAYAEFRDAFDANAAPINKTFVRGDVVNADPGSADGTGEPRSKLYKPMIPAVLKKKHSPASFEQAKRLAEEKARRMVEEASKKSNRPPKPGTVKETKRGPSNLEAFKEELRQMQEARVERRGLREQLKQQLGVDAEAIDRIAPSLDNPYLAGGGGDYENDPSTTNLYVSNLPLDIQMEDLYETFGSFGPLASAKILWPRPDEERRRDHLCGFIAFMTRTDTDRAIAGMQDQMVRGCDIRMSFAKPVNMPVQPVYIPPSLLKLTMPDPPSGLPFNAQPRPGDMENFSEQWAFPAPGMPAPEPGCGGEQWNQMIRNATVRVVIPTERALLTLIHRTIEFVINEGPMFEAMLMSRERNNPLFRFLFDNQHPAHVYYRWKLFSLLQGEAPHNWRTQNFRLFENGSWWQPPPIELFRQGMPECLYDTAITGVQRFDKKKSTKKQKQSTSRVEATSPRQRTRRTKTASPNDEDDADEGHARREARIVRPARGSLRAKERDALEDLLRALTPERNQIGDAMLWCVEHSSCAKEISDCLFESLTIDETPLHKKMARLYLIADILANCAVPRVRDVFYYRQYLGDQLERVMLQLNRTYEQIEARLKAEQFKQRVMACFRIWEETALYPTEHLIRLQNVFLGLVKATAVMAIVTRSIVSLQEPEVFIETEINEDLDGTPMPSDSTVRMEEEDDLDGAPLQEEGDEQEEKESEDQESTSGGKSHGFVISKWDQVDPELVQQQAMTTSKWEMLEENRLPEGDSPEDVDGRPMEEGEDDSSPEASTNESVAIVPVMPPFAPISIDAKKDSSEQRRKQLREIEVKAMALQDQLEAEKADDVALQVERYRAELLRKLDDIGHGEKSRKSNSSSSGVSKREKADKMPSAISSSSSTRRRRSRSRNRDDRSSGHHRHRR